VNPGNAPDRPRISSAPKRPTGTNREPRVVDDRGAGERRVRIVRLGEDTGDRRTPRTGPGNTDENGPTIRHRPGDDGVTTITPRTRPDTGARPRVSIHDPGTNDGDGTTQVGKGGKGDKKKKGGHKASGHKKHKKHHHHRDDCRCNSCSFWYWGSYWCYPGYRYSWCWGWPWYGAWPSYGRFGYRYSSWYGYWPDDYGYGYASSDSVTQPAYTGSADTSYVPVVIAPDPCPRTQAEAWGLLADGRPGEAAEAFDCLAEAIPDDGQPLVGYALAAALLDEHEVAVANMRLALQTDPETLRYVPEDERLHGQLTQLVEHYEYRARHQYGDVDALFMVASLWYLLNQERAAHYAIEIATTLGDNDAGTISLRLLIESALP
jgi:hypothetical protein